MKKDNVEVVIAFVVACFSWVIDHYTAIMGAVLVTISVACYALKLRREWRARNQKPDND